MESWSSALGRTDEKDAPPGGNTTTGDHQLLSYRILSKAMSTQLDIVYKLKEALETGNPEVAAPFMAENFTHQALPAQYVYSIEKFTLDRSWGRY